MIARRCAVKRQRAALRQQLETAREGGFAGVADDIIGAFAAVKRLIFGDQRCACRLPRARRFGVFWHDRVEIGETRVFAVDRADCALLLRDEGGAFG